MAAVDDQLAAIESSISELKTAFLAKLAEKEARAVDAEKKLQDAAASAVSLDALKTFFDKQIADLKGALE